jgi:hypothetical protein
VFPRKLLVTTLVFVCGIASIVVAQQAPANPQATNAQQPQVKVNVLNVCSPSADDQKELTSALAKVPRKPSFGKDYEIARGHSTLDPNAPMPGMQALPSGTVSAANWVRVRREFPDSLFANVQYSFSIDAENMVETLVLRVRDPKDLMEVTLEDSASAVAPARSMLSSDTPVSRIRLERFGKSSVVLARCSAEGGKPAPDQSAYEPIFSQASAILSRYRDALGVRRTVPRELALMGVGNSANGASDAKKKP